jgi:hypothetical protein
MNTFISYGTKLNKQPFMISKLTYFPSFFQNLVRENPMILIKISYLRPLGAQEENNKPFIKLNFRQLLGNVITILIEVVYFAIQILQ